MLSHSQFLRDSFRLFNHVIYRFIFVCFCFLADSVTDNASNHDDVIKWKHFPRYWPFVWGIHRWPVNSPHEGQWHRALIFSSICTWTKGWVANRIPVIWDATALIMTSLWWSWKTWVKSRDTYPQQNTTKQINICTGIFYNLCWIQHWFLQFSHNNFILISFSTKRCGKAKLIYMFVIWITFILSRWFLSLSKSKSIFKMIW